MERWCGEPSNQYFDPSQIFVTDKFKMPQQCSDARMNNEHKYQGKSIWTRSVSSKICLFVQEIFIGSNICRFGHKITVFFTCFHAFAIDRKKWAYFVCLHCLLYFLFQYIFLFLIHLLFMRFSFINLLLLFNLLWKLQSFKGRLRLLSKTFKISHQT